MKASALLPDINFAHPHTDGDVVILRDKKDASREGTLLKLRQSKTTNTYRGFIDHADIIGKQPRQLVHSSKGIAYRIHEPTLAEYVRLTPRIVTPVRLLKCKLCEQKVDQVRFIHRMRT